MSWAENVILLVKWHHKPYFTKLFSLPHPKKNKPPQLGGQTEGNFFCQHLTGELGHTLSRGWNCAASEPCCKGIGPFTKALLVWHLCKCNFGKDLFAKVFMARPFCKGLHGKTFLHAFLERPFCKGFLGKTLLQRPCWQHPFTKVGICVHTCMHP